MNTVMIYTVAWVRVEQGRILCARPRGKDVFYIPGGKREAGETDREALLREVAEELTVTLLPATIRPAGTYEALQTDGAPKPRQADGAPKPRQADGAPKLRHPNAAPEPRQADGAPASLQRASAPQSVAVRMSCYTADYSGTLAPSSEIAELAWYSYADRARVPPVDQLLFDDLNATGQLR
jgi:8-oxo-dGTP diphosphatase